MRYLCVLLLLSACSNSTPPNPIVGRWNMDRVVQDDSVDVSNQHNPKADRYIVFQEDGMFESGGSTMGKNTGRWTLDPATSELFLDSDAGEDDDSYWIVSHRDNRMIWQGTRYDFNKRFRIEHVRGAESK